MPNSQVPSELQICLNSRPTDCCERRGALALFRELKQKVGDRVLVRPATCMGLCKQGVALRLKLNGVEHLMIEGNFERADELLRQHGL